MVKLRVSYHPNAMKIICIISYSPGHTFHRLTSGNLHFYLTLVPGWPDEMLGPISHARRMVHNAVWTPEECLPDRWRDQEWSSCCWHPPWCVQSPACLHWIMTLRAQVTSKTFLRLWFSSNIWNMKGINDLTKDKGHCTGGDDVVGPRMFYWVTETNL